MALILLVEDEKLLRWALEQQLKRAGHTVLGAPDLATAAAHLESRQPDVVLLDLGLPDGHGLDFYEANRERLEGSVVIVMTALGQVGEAVRAMKLGALDFLSKPVDQAELVALVHRSLAVRGDQLEAQAARQSRERHLAQTVIADSPQFREVIETAEQVAASEVASILIQGESGSGKNVVARYIHSASPRRARPFIEVSCATIPENLLESELFGHEKGAFTDAKSTKRGVFELAEGRHGGARRDRRAAPRPAGEAPALPRGAPLPAGRRDARDHRRRAGHRAHQPRPAGDGARQELPQRPLLPPERLPDLRRAGARAARRTSCRSPATSSPPCSPSSAGASTASTARPRTASSPTPGRGTCASCATSSSAPWCSSAARRSRRAR